MTQCVRELMLTLLMLLNGPLVPENYVSCAAIHCIEADGSILQNDVVCVTREKQLSWQGKLDLVDRNQKKRTRDEP